MGEIVIPIPEELEEDFKKLNPLLLQLAIQKLVREKLQGFVEAEKLLSKSKLTEEEALELGREVNRSLAKKYEGLR